AFGLALATGIPIVPGSFRDGIAYLLDFQWNIAQRQEVTVSFIEPGSASSLSDLRHLPGVISAQPFRTVPVRLRFGHRWRRLAVTGIPRDAMLQRVLDDQAQPIELPADGLLVSAKLAEVLGAKPGDRLRLEVQEGLRPIREAVIQGVITDFMGIGAYMEIGALRRLMREGGTISGAHLAVDRARWSEFLASVKEAPRIATLGIKAASRKAFEKSTGDMLGTITTIYFTFAVIVSFGVVYNSARIALSERSRDLATLRVVGFTQGEVAGVLIIELALLTLIAIPAGFWIGSQLATFIVTTTGTETIRLPLILTSQSYASAVLVVLISATLSFALVSRRIRELDMIGVLKARD
ncbi:MAG: FtsX-like permease family protein, partial [Verrucomicrobiaceae bacterium]|nr:FtsX-like permease family protein [Verrucomicrobiaceae bacterium]